MSVNDEPVLLSGDCNGVCTLTLNRPDRTNAINAQLWVELAAALRAAAIDRDLRALVITGAGGAFSTEAYAAFAEKREPAFTGRWAVPAHARSTEEFRSE